MQSQGGQDGVGEQLHTIAFRCAPTKPRHRKRVAVTQHRHRELTKRRWVKLNRVSWSGRCLRLLFTASADISIPRSVAMTMTGVTKR